MSVEWGDTALRRNLNAPQVKGATAGIAEPIGAVTPPGFLLPRFPPNFRVPITKNILGREGAECK
jgi:hypothetical protein